MACPSYGFVTTTVGNTAVGAYAGHCAHKVCFNLGSVFVGYKAGCTNDSTGYNVFVGNCSAATSTSAYQNVAVGFMAGCNLTTGRCNVMIGICAGRSLTTGVGNIYIGARACTVNAAASNEIVIGSIAGCGSNTLRLGNTSLAGIRAAVTTICLLYTSPSPRD